MILKEGKFFRDGIEIPLEHGNAEQIALMGRQIAFLESIASDGFLICPNFNGTEVWTRFDCICGEPVYFSHPSTEDDIGSLIGLVQTCKGCNLKFIIQLYEGYIPVVKKYKK